MMCLLVAFADTHGNIINHSCFSTPDTSKLNLNIILEHPPLQDNYKSISDEFPWYGEGTSLSEEYGSLEDGAKQVVKWNTFKWNAFKWNEIKNIPFVQLIQQGHE